MKHFISRIQSNRDPIIKYLSLKKLNVMTITFLLGSIAIACTGGNDDNVANAGNANAASSSGYEFAPTNVAPPTNVGTTDGAGTTGAAPQVGAEGAAGTTSTSVASSEGGSGVTGTAGAAENDKKNRPISDASGEGVSVTTTATGSDEQDNTEADSGPVADCTPSDWNDPGTVSNPDVIAVAPDAGSTGHVFGGAWALEDYDYVEEEFFFSNSSPQSYTTRMVVRRPRDPAMFSGTVFQEWLNVSGMMDVAVMWGTSREYFMREGHVHVSVSAQLNGIGTLQAYDPERYEPIDHPGDQASDEIFSQAAVAVRSQTELLLGPCMPVQTVIAVGQSQSAMRLASYVDSSQSKYRIFDGFLIHSGPQPASNNPDVPVMMIHTMTEGNCTLADSPNMVCWVVAGSTHNDARIMEREIDEVGSCFGLTEPPFECANPMNEFPAWRVYNAALDWLNRWVRKGERPPAGDPFVGTPPLSAVDEHGNALGGVRIPDIDVPIATHNNNNAPLNPFDLLAILACGLSGNSVYFPESKLLQLYPTHEIYVEKYTAAADQALKKGYLLQEDYDDAIQEAQEAPIPN